MNILQLLSKRRSKFITFYHFVRVILILIQYNNGVNSIQLRRNSNLTNGDYVSDILWRSKRQQEIGLSCQIPSFGVHVSFTILGESRTTYRPGDFAQNFNTLEVSCVQGYKPKPFLDKRTICISGQWNPALTISCLRTCPSLNSTISTRVTCKYHNIPLENCNNPIEETTAYLSCNPLYEQDDLQKNRIRLCRAGRWIPSISECYPTCGIKRPEGRLNIVNGQNASLGDYPWQVGIYNAQKELLCGGSIIDRHIILTAAHCVSDYYGNVKPIEDYFIAAGKYYRKYDDNKDGFAQYSKVLHIFVPERYTGILNNFGLDIAIILLSDPFTISVQVQPVCIELNVESPYLHLSSNSSGIVTGWGYTEEGRELSEVLKELVIPYIPYRKCFEEVPNMFKKYVTPDKICGGYLNNGTSVCGGDSGGGLVFENTLSGRYYVKGIVSTSPSTGELVCDSNQYSLYTSINQHVDFLTNILAYNQMQQSIEITAEDVTTEERELVISTCSGEHFISDMLHQNISMRPQIIPKSDEFTINAESTFEMKCLSKNFVIWTSPNNLEEIFTTENLTKHSTITIKSSKCNSIYESLLTIHNASYLDVGFYYCHENTTDPTDSTKSSSIYIFVHDDQNLILMPKYRSIIASVGSKVTLPCRPTAPDVLVKLLFNGIFEIPLGNENLYDLTYDSKIGFTANKISGSTVYAFVCNFSRRSYKQSAKVGLFLEELPPEPLIKKSFKELEIGQPLHLECSIWEVRLELSMIWIIPDLSGIDTDRVKISNEVVNEKMGKNQFSNLTINPTRIEDQGNYTCLVKNLSNDINSATVFIKLNDKTIS